MPVCGTLSTVDIDNDELILVSGASPGGLEGLMLQEQIVGYQSCPTRPPVLKDI